MTRTRRNLTVTTRSRAGRRSRDISSTATGNKCNKTRTRRRNWWTNEDTLTLTDYTFYILQVYEPPSVPQVWEQAVRDGKGQDGGDAAAQHVLDRGPVPQEESGHPLRVPPDSHVHLCLCLLFEEKQQSANFWGEFKNPLSSFNFWCLNFSKSQDNQKDLETATEQLSEYLERDISAENLVDIKQKVQDKYRWQLDYYGHVCTLLMLLMVRYCDSRRKVLLAHVHEGYDMDWWLYTEANC